MPDLITLNVTHVMRGPTLRINLTITSGQGGVGVNEATSATLVIDNLVHVRVKVRHEDCYCNRHNIYMIATKRELAKYYALGMNVTCVALKYSKKWTCSDFNGDWNNIGQISGQSLRTSSNAVYLSQTEIVITVYDMSKAEFQMLYDNCDWTDFTLSTTDGDVAVHKAILAVRSPVFKAMFTGTWKEAEENKVEIKDYSLQTVQDLKAFLYLGTLPDVGLRPLLSLAALYCINDLKKDCIRKLAETVQPEDLHSLHEFACVNNMPDLSCAITLLTPGCVVDEWYKMQKEKGENQIK